MSGLSNTTDAERSLLGGVLVDPSTLDRVCEITTGSHFASKTLGRTFDHVADLYAGGVAVGDVTVLAAELRKAGSLDDLGGIGGLASLIRDVPHSANVEYHAREVRRLYQCRRLHELAGRITADASERDADPAAIAAMIDAATHTVATDTSSHVTTLSDAMARLADRLETDRDQEEIGGVTTGIDSLDLMTGGVLPGELTVIGARTSIGKTAFGMQMAMDAASGGARTLVASLEMQELQLAQRIAASRLGLSLIDQRTGEITQADVERVRDYASECRSVPLFIMGARRAKMAQIRGVARATKSVSGLDLLLVDYLQLIAPSDPRKPRYEQVTEISSELKSLAMELDVPVVALAQLNRQGENEKPKLSQLRESGAIEQDADSVWFLHRASREASDASLIVAKQRQGKVGEIPLRFNGERCQFTEPPVESYSNFEPAFGEYSQ